MTKKPDNTSSYFPCVLSRKHFNVQICWVRLKEKFKISEARKERTGKKKKKKGKGERSKVWSFRSTCPSVQNFKKIPKAV